MAKKRSLAELTMLLQQAGSTNPTSWAASELEEDIPQFSRFLVLKMMFDSVIEEGSGSKMADAWTKRKPNTNLDHYDRGTEAAHRLLSSGANPDDLVDLIRSEQISLLFAICYGLGAPDIPEDLDDFAWHLVDGYGREIAGLEESVNEVCAELCKDGSHHHY